MSELTACAGHVPYEFTYEDKIYKVSHLTQKVKAEFEQRQFNRAIEAARQLKTIMTKGEYSQHLKDLNNDFIQGEFGFESSKGIAILQNKKAIITLCSLLFSVEEDMMWRMMRTHEEEIAAKLQLIIKESLGIKDEEVVAATDDVKE